MRIAVCDNDEGAVSHIEEMITEYRINRQVFVDCRYFTNSTDFLCELRGGEYDLILLDILMPEDSGIGIAMEIREQDQNVRIIFVAASADFAVESYSVGAYYYLLKPIDRVSFFQMLDKIEEEISQQAEQGFVLKSKDGIVRIAYAKLVYMEVMNKTIFFHLSDGAVRETVAALSDFEERLLLRPEFLKTHRAYLVNLNYIQVIESNCIVMKDGGRLPISRLRRSQVQDAYMRLLSREDGKDLTFFTDKPKYLGGPWRILLVDDDPADRALWTDILQSHGCVVLTADNGEDALRLAASSHCDCALLDVMIPGEDGFGICDRLHKLSDMPVIFLSSLTELDKQVEGFASGGIDYITKDTPAELFWAKVRTRIQLAMSASPRLSCGPLLLDLAGRKVSVGEKEIPLAPIEFDILCCFLERREHIFTPEEIYSLIWGDRPWDGGQLVQTHMSRLRRKLDKAWEGHRFIETVWGQGYRFVPVE